MHIKLKKRPGGVLLLEAAIASIILVLISYGVVQVNSAMFNGLSASQDGYQAQFVSTNKANEINATDYTLLASQARAAVTGTNFEREVIVDTERDLGSGVYQKDVTINTYAPGIATPTYSLLLQPTNKGNLNTVPVGTIVMWSGTSIPTNWSICNGSNGTPDMRDRLPVGAGGERAVGRIFGNSNATGWTIPGTAGITNVVDTNHDHYVDLSGNTLGHALTIPEMPSHNHKAILGHWNNYDGGGGNQAVNNSPSGDWRRETTYTGGDLDGKTVPHSHLLSGTVISRYQSAGPHDNGHLHSHAVTTAAQWYEPPTYAVYFIIKTS